MTPLQNPFFAGGAVPPEHFLGRIKQVNTVFDHMVKRAHVAISGSPGMGKTSLLRYVESAKAWQERKRDPSAVVIVYLNCMEIYPFSPPDFWRAILFRLQQGSGGDAALQGELDLLLHKEHIDKNDVSEAVVKIRQRGRYVVLLLDDFGGVLSRHANYSETDMLTFLYACRSLALSAQDDQGNLSMIVTSFRPLREFGPPLPSGSSPWYNHYFFLGLKSLTNAEVNAILKRMPTQWALTPAQKEAVLEMTGGNPALLQSACYLLYQSHEAGETPAEDINVFVSDFLSAIEQFFRNSWDFSTDIEKMLLMLVALSRLNGRLQNQHRYDLSDVDTLLSQMEHELNDLEERGILQRTVQQRRNVYSFSSSLMEWWVIKEIENSKDEEELAQRQIVFFNMSKKQVEQLKGVLKQVWEAKDAVQSVVHWAGKLVGAFTKGAAGA